MRIRNTQKKLNTQGECMEKILTVADVAEKLQLSVSTIYKYTESQKIPSVKVGNRIRVTEEKLAQFILSCQNNGIKKEEGALK
jgi:PTS system nitrogen regulatory IIA component